MAKNQTGAEENLPRQIRVSVGSAIVLGFLKGKLDAAPTTAYLMTYKPSKCTANCLFCPQARTSHSKAELLSRVSWPIFATKQVFQKIGIEYAIQKIKRVCIQALNYPEVFTHLTNLVKALKKHSNVPISVSCQPQNAQDIRRLAEAGADRIGIAIDAATEKLFNEVKGVKANGPYKWEKQFEHILEAVSVFGKGNVSTHIIVGIGETEKESAHIIQQCTNMGVSPALFAFTPIRGTALESKSQPLLVSYRRIQLARWLIVNDYASYSDMTFNTNGKITDFGMEKEKLTQIVETGNPFLTSGCPSCNRPFYNEKPSGPIYNYPRNMHKKEIETIKEQLS